MKYTSKLVKIVICALGAVSVASPFANVTPKFRNIVIGAAVSVAATVLVLSLSGTRWRE